MHMCRENVDVSSLCINIHNLRINNLYLYKNVTFCHVPEPRHINVSGILSHRCDKIWDKNPMHNLCITLEALGFTCDVTTFCHIWSVLLTIFYFYFLF